MATVFTPEREELLEFCRQDPIERVFLEEMARRGLGRFRAIAGDGGLAAVAHIGVNVVPSGRGCGAFATLLSGDRSRMIIGDEPAVTELWDSARAHLPQPREDRPGQPVFVIERMPDAGGSGLRPARPEDLDLLVPASARAHAEELGTDPLERDAEGFRWRTRAQIDEGRSWIWEDGDVILFKAEAAAWTPHAVQLQQVWVDPPARNQGYAQRGLRDLFRLLLEQVPAICLFVRPENAPAIRVYENVGMRRHGSYRSLLL